MNGNIRNSIIIFLDEAVGFRKSIHHLHRWFETGSDNELEQLAVEISRENFLDIWPILNFIKDGSHEEAVKEILLTAMTQGIHMPRDWAADPNKVNAVPSLPKLPVLSTCNVTETAGLIWAIRDWVDYGNEQLGVNPLSCLGMMYQYVVDARNDFKLIFKLLEMLFGYETLASCVHDGSNQLFAEVIGKHYYPDYRNHIKYLVVAMEASPELNWVDALSRNQVKSKLWLLNKIKDFPEYKKKVSLGEQGVTTVIVGGWVGLLPFLSNMIGLNLGNVINVDIDTSVHGAATALNAGLYTNYKNSNKDIRKFNFKKYTKLVIIDTIVEHFENHGEWVKTLPPNAKIVLQGNDMFHVPDHVNCHKYISDFETGCGLNSVHWLGDLNLHKCTRFMAIGTT